MVVSLTETPEGVQKPSTGVVKKKPIHWTQRLSDPVEIARRFCAFWYGVYVGIFLLLLPTDSPTKIKCKQADDLAQKRTLAHIEPLDLKRVKEIKNRFGGTVNDVLCCLLAGSIRRYLEKENCPCVKKKNLQVSGLFPCNLRMGELNIQDPSQFGNQFAIVAMPLAC